MTSPSYVTKKQIAESLLKAGVSPQDPPTCLLYTSDAADE